jgi:HK97 family phage prohead protease
MNILIKDIGSLKSFDYRLSIEAKDVNAEGEFEGYASTFGNVDQGGDIVEPGAFIESVVDAKKDGRTIPMLWQHDQREPIGIWKDIAEDRKGLYVKGQLLIDADPLAKRAHGLLKAKALGGMSIGYRIPAGGAEPDEKKPGVMRLVKVDLREISLVTMPMNIQARVTTVKSILDGGKLPTVREFEEFLRDAGFSKTLATAIASKATPHLRGEPEAKADDALKFLSALRA